MCECDEMEVMVVNRLEICLRKERNKRMKIYKRERGSVKADAMGGVCVCVCSCRWLCVPCGRRFCVWVSVCDC